MTRKRLGKPGFADLSVLTIVYKSYGGETYGGERSGLATISGLNHWRTAVVTNRENGFVELARANGVQTAVIPLGGLREGWRKLGTRARVRRLAAWMRYCRRLYKMVRRVRPTVIHCNDVEAWISAAPVLFATRKPVVLHVRCELKMSMLHNFAMGLATRVVPVSYGIAGVHLKKAHPCLRERIARRTVVIPNGVALDEAVVDGGGTGGSATGSGGAPSVLISGSLEPRKGQLEFIRECIPRIWREVEARFIFVGGSKGLHDQYAKACKAAAANIDHGGRIEFPGYEADITDRIRACSVVALPSNQEGLPRILLEAAALARPAVAFEIPGVSDVIKDGVTGWIVEHGDWISFARLIALACQDETVSARAGVCARRRVEEHFSIRLARARFERVLDEVAVGGARRPRPAHRGYAGAEFL